MGGKADVHNIHETNKKANWIEMVSLIARLKSAILCWIGPISCLESSSPPFHDYEDYSVKDGDICYALRATNPAIMIARCGPAHKVKDRRNVNLPHELFEVK